MEEQEEVKEILDKPVRIRFGVVDIHRLDRGFSFPRLAQALMQGQRFIERRSREPWGFSWSGKRDRTTRDALLYYKARNFTGSSVYYVKIDY